MNETETSEENDGTLTTYYDTTNSLNSRNSSIHNPLNKK